MKILLAIDGTKHSDGMIDLLRKLNLCGPIELWIISVVDMAIHTSLEIFGNRYSTAEEIENAVIENAVNSMETTSKMIGITFAHKDISIMHEIRYGSPESRIVEKAEQIQADLIIVGSHCYNRWKTLLRGSVSDAILHRAPCSVLVVRNP